MYPTKHKRLYFCLFPLHTLIRSSEFQDEMCSLIFKSLGPCVVFCLIFARSGCPMWSKKERKIMTLSAKQKTDSGWRGTRGPIEGKGLLGICKGAVNQWFQTTVRYIFPMVQCPAVMDPQLLCQPFPRLGCVLLKGWHSSFQNISGNFRETGTVIQTNKNFTISICVQ